MRMERPQWSFAAMLEVSSILNDCFIFFYARSAECRVDRDRLALLIGVSLVLCAVQGGADYALTGGEYRLFMAAYNFIIFGNP